MRRDSLTLSGHIILPKKSSAVLTKIKHMLENRSSQAFDDLT
jgi:hypothetical protein